jgi:inosine triphosphate pyrophosphatase
MALYFITGNPEKLTEAKAILGDVEQIELDLLEIQDLDQQKIIAEKLREATKQHKGEFFVEDTSLYLDCLNGFPGPLIKWMLERIGNKGIFELVSKYENKEVTAKTVVGWTNGKDIKFFTGEAKGIIVSPRGPNDFGWDQIFQPLGYEKCWSEMSREEKNKISMRRKALLKMKEYLEK